MTGCAGTAPSILCPPLTQSTALRHLLAPLPLPFPGRIWDWRGMMHIYPCSVTTVINQQGEMTCSQPKGISSGILSQKNFRRHPPTMTRGRHLRGRRLITGIPHRSMMLTEPSTGGLLKISRGSGIHIRITLRLGGWKRKNASWENYDRVQTLSTSV